MKTPTKILLFVMATVAVLFSSARFYTDYLWLLSLGYQHIFLRTMLAQASVFALAFVLALAFFWPNLEALRGSFAGRTAKNSSDNIRYYPTEQPWRETIETFLRGKGVTWGLRGLAAALSVLVALPASSAGFAALQFWHAQPAGVVDPIYQQDISFFLFRLPFIGGLVAAALGVAFMFSLIILAIYLLTNTINLSRGGNPRAIRHLSVLVALLLVLQAISYRLDSYRLAYSPRGVAFGASYTDLFATRPILYILMVLALLGAAIALANLKLLRIKLLTTVPTLMVGISLLVGTIYPAIIQQYVVEPNELARETPFIRHNIEFTRRAFGLDNLTIKDLPAPIPFAPSHLDEHAYTLANTRLLDWTPLLQSYRQLQGIRTYYRFHDVDIDRYQLDGQLEQVMLAARELSIADLNPAARTWINMHLRYTHGFGAVVSPVNRIGPRGEPLFYVQDIPPRSVRPELAITRPEIYFGEFPGGYVIINAKTDEFSFPMGEENATTRYAGQDGIVLTPFNKLMFSLRYGTTMLLLSDDVQSDSRILFHRNIMDRVRMIAPFLTYDPDPYLVINEGRLFWMLDAYTTSTHYPYSTPLAPGSINYIRNSIKVVVDAYHGTVDFYQADQEDPIANTLRAAFPGFLKPLSAMPAGLRRHIRYPEQLLNIQAQVLATYHMTSPSTFYNKEDIWRIAREQQGGQERAMQPYYVIMNLPGTAEDRNEFALVLPLTPAGTAENPKHNMIAYLAGRSDGEDYGELILYRFPKDVLVQGPMQIEARINQDADISPLLTLWGQGGSVVFRGNLLVIPLGDTLIYVQPLYIQAAGNSLPELKRVIVATADDIAMAPTFTAALAELAGSLPPTTPPPTTPPPAHGGTLPLQQLAQAIEQAFNQAQEAARTGNWAGYGQHLQELERLIGELNRLRP
ncbi:MAG: UPF0182 family protein [Peptococcaceae bacterium]|nr:UPF0182 family protein [Peptococcaceae bacterium]